MRATFFYLLMLQKYINSKRSILKWKKLPLFFGNISGDFSANSMKKARLNGCLYDFSVDYKAFHISHITNIYKYLIKKYDMK